MKKFSFIGSILLLAAVVTFLFIGCQKESAATADDSVTAGSESAVSKGTDGGANAISGLISEENAQRMANEFRKQNPNAKTLWVGYSAKDLTNFLKLLNNKYKCDSIYVNFGIYDRVSAHTPDQIGRTTIFFTGNRNPKYNASSVRTNEATDEDPSSNSLNRGQTGPN